MASRTNAGPAGLSEILYAFTSASNNNGSAFAGLSADTPFYNTALGLCMLIGRFVLITLILALAGSLARQHRRSNSSSARSETGLSRRSETGLSMRSETGLSRRSRTDGSLPTHTPLFVALHVITALVVTGLTFFPALALGPIASAIS